MKVLGISAYHHNAAAALVADGAVVAAVQEDRFSRRKGDPAFPKSAIRFCLERGAVTAPSELDAVVFYEKPFRKFYRVLSSLLANAPASLASFKRAMEAWFGEKLWVRETIAKSVGVPRAKVAFSEHHLSHAASVFLTNRLDSAAVIVADGVGEWETTTVGRMEGGDRGALSFDVVKSIDFPHSLGLFYSAVTAYLGFEVNEGEGKVMGLAPYGRPAASGLLDELVDVRPDGDFRLDLKFFRHDRSTRRGWSDELERLLGRPRSPSPLEFDHADPEFAASREAAYCDVARSAQEMLEARLLDLARVARDSTGEEELCLAGGVALNCVANSKIAASGLFRRVHVHPASDDSGAALGAALAYCLSNGDRPAESASFCPYLGPDLGSTGLPSLDDYHVREPADAGEYCRAVAERLAAGKVVGWMHGRSEWGPRALGARSILARPDDRSLSDHISRHVKRRDLFRPYAPVVLAEFADECFEGFSPGKTLERCMLGTVVARPKWRDRLAGVAHVDGTARVQVLSRDDHELLARVVETFHELTGLPVLLNTSLNLPGEPLAVTVEDGLRVFRESKMDVLALPGRLVER